MQTSFVLSLLVLAAALAAAGAGTGGVVVLDLITSPPPVQTVLAVQVCVGLMNRNVSAGAPLVYTLMHPEDTQWLGIVNPELPSPPPTTPISAFMASCIATLGRRVIRYSYAEQQAIVPNLITLAAVLDAVPLEDGSPFLPPAPVIALDVQSAWAGFTPYNATLYMYTHHVNATTTIAKMNPGYDEHAHPARPPLTLSPDLSLADFIVQQRLFNFYLVDGCIPGTPENDLEEEMALHNPWPRPIAVFGYDDTWPIAGDLFEAETTCVRAKSMGQVATTGVNNLAYFSRAQAITAPLRQNDALPFAYNASRTYLSVVIGDGDNIAYIKDQRYSWFQSRLAQCAGQQAKPCFPLLWSISPHLIDVAPDLMRWYYAGALTTARDWFVLPPSGWLYAYPGLMSADVQAAFVAATERAANLMSTNGTTEWEFAGTWSDAIANYIPRYSRNNVIRALFAVNVPYLFPVVDFLGKDRFFKVINETTVLFAPFEWRGTSGSADPDLHPFLLSPAEMAAKIAAFPPGTATAMYVTSDGGATLDDVVAMAALLPEHVEVVDVDALVAAALKSEK